VEERVAGTVDLQDGEMMAVLVGGKKVLLARVDGSFHATAARCPHWGGPLPEGTLHAPRLLCPWHKATFDVRSGDLLEPPALDGIAAFRVRVDGDPRVVAVIGAAAAAEAAAEALRQLFFIGRIVMIGPEEHWPYDRPNLSKDSLGIAGSDGCRSFESLLARVDLALDEAKRAGSGSCRTYRAASAQVAMSD
jgi:nitrite reductase/ring-hydroxylating ferredoxin subunit